MNLTLKALRVVTRCKNNAQRQNAARWLKLARRAASGQQRLAINALMAHLSDDMAFEAIYLSRELRQEVTL